MKRRPLTDTERTLLADLRRQLAVVLDQLDGALNDDSARLARKPLATLVRTYPAFVMLHDSVRDT